jgi:muramoyltetrapeptide carboxypeptidase LdcA involved in peptidoglycan recycling
MPIAKTAEIGHGHDSKAVIIGRELQLGSDPYSA